MKNINFKYLWLGLALVAAAAGAVEFRPTQRLADQGPKVNLEAMIPAQFGEWHIDDLGSNQLVNPQTQAAIDKIYTQVLSRTYVNAEGYRIMLMLPYGADQSDDMGVHDPAGCYPAQGFRILGNRKDLIKTVYGFIPARRMEAENGPRYEPVTYWSTIGNKAVNDDWDRKLAQLSYVLDGQIPDGLLFRVSSIDPDAERAYRTQDAFINALLQALARDARVRVAGMTSGQSAPDPFASP
jgi:EpsI family protein